MKKKLVSMICSAAIVASLAASCAYVPVAPAAPAAEPAAQEAQESAEEAEAEEAGDEGELHTAVMNQWVEITEEEAKTYCSRLFKAPDGAKVLSWSMLEGSEADSFVGSPLIQLDFEMEEPDLIFTARAQQGVPEDKDIAGLFTEWDETEDVTLANWGMDRMQGTVSRETNESGMIDLCSWYDVEIGILYTLSTAAADLEGFDIQAVAEAMYNADNEPFTGDDYLDRMTYMSPDGWNVAYDPQLFEAMEIDEHSAQFVYLGESAGSNVITVSYVEGEDPEKYLDELTADWSDDAKKVEGTFPGTEDTPGFWRMSPEVEEGSGLYETLIAGAYKDGVLVLDAVEHKSGDEETDTAVSDAMAEVINTITYRTAE